MRTSRINITTKHPLLYRAAVDAAAQAETAALRAGISGRLVELVKIRVSQINGCAFCLRAHTTDALKKGESVERIAVLPAWRETTYFDETEKAALGLAEMVTEIGSLEGREAYAKTVAALAEDQVSAVAWVAVAMNTFNRIAVTSGYDVGPVR